METTNQPRKSVIGIAEKTYCIKKHLWITEREVKEGIVRYGAICAGLILHRKIKDNKDEKGYMLTEKYTKGVVAGLDYDLTLIEAAEIISEYNTTRCLK